MTLGLPTIETAKRAGATLLVVIVAGAVMLGAFLLLIRLVPRHDPTPIVTARKDERKAADVSTAIGAATAAHARDSAVHVDITTKEIRDAFQSVPTAQPAPVGTAPALPAAPVDRLRQRINESIARANGAAGPAVDPD